MRRLVLIGLCLIVALTAMGGGVALVTGLEGSRYPIAMLRTTPFSDYLVPGVILLVIVGGSAATATVLTVIGSRPAALVSIAAGLILMGWMVGEVLLLPAESHSWFEAAYFVTGAIIVVLGWREGAGRPWLGSS